MAFINFVTIAVGRNVSAAKINAAYNSVLKHYNGKHTPRFYCITNQRVGLRFGVNVIRPLCSVDIPAGWHKLYLFTPLMPPGRLVYFDFGTVFTREISDIIDNYSGLYCGVKHPRRSNLSRGIPKEKIPPIDTRLSTSFVMMESGHGREVWRAYIRNQDNVHRIFKKHGDRVFTSWKIGRFDLFQDIFPSQKMPLKAGKK